MSTGWLKRAVVLVAGVALSAGIAVAKDHDFNRGRHERWEHARHERRMERRHENFREHRRFERERWRERREHERMRWAEHHRDHRTPAGWDHGRKTGWNGASVPPARPTATPANHGQPRTTQWAKARFEPRHGDHRSR